jgi:GT2 family glycosyltransferase
VVPHRSRRDLLVRTLAALGARRVLVVDDGDAPLDLDVPRVRLGGGQGFARAANAGLAAVRTPFAIVLNDDALPLGDCLDRLVARGGLCGPVLVGPAGVESAGLDVGGWGRVVQRRRVRSGPVPALSGACLHMPARLRFDPAFRHGGEDVELCRRVGGAWLVGEARCWHLGGATVRRTGPAAQRAAVEGHLRLYPSGRQDPAILALHVAQVVREGGPWARIPAIVEGWRAVRG